jgi:hypothetical protein
METDTSRTARHRVSAYPPRDGDSRPLRYVPSRRNVAVARHPLTLRDRDPVEAHPEPQSDEPSANVAGVLAGARVNTRL